MSNSTDSETSKNTSLAIALKEDRKKESVPSRIVATGRGSAADQIIEIALENGVKIREDTDLAQILSLLEVESIVPIEELATVSEILAYVYRSNSNPPDNSEVS